MENIIFTQLTTEQLKVAISDAVESALLKQQVAQPILLQTEYINRKETAKILGISLVSLNQWTKSGLIQGYRIGTRIRYKKEEVLNSLTKIKSGRI